MMKRKTTWTIAFFAAATMAFFVAVTLVSCHGAPNVPEGPPMLEREDRPFYKRGVSYSFEQGGTTWEDMALLAPGIYWFYNWWITMPTEVAEAAVYHGIEFIPQVWDIWDFEPYLNRHMTNHPRTRYIKGFNEPNLTDQANMTPAQAAPGWRRFMRAAREHNLTVISPAVNFGTLENYWLPWVWLDEFFGIDSIDQETGRITRNRGFRGVSLDDVHAIRIHSYMRDPGAMKWFISTFKRYNRPIWLTEFCAWEDVASPEQQMQFMSEMLAYLELDPWIERYAWFIPKGSEHESVHPFNKLLTHDNPPQLTPLGVVFVNMSRFDCRVFIPAGELLTASNITNLHLSEYVDSEILRPEGPHWPRVEYGYTRGASVHFRPGTDPGGAVLDMFNFTRQNWIEYQVEIPESRTYTLSMRNMAEAPTEMAISVNGQHAATFTFEPIDVWTTSSVPLELEAGRHTLRFRVNEGYLSLNWLRLD